MLKNDTVKNENEWSVFFIENAVYNVTEIGKGSFCIDDKGVHAYLFIGLEYALLVDTVFGTGNIKEFVETLTDKTIKSVSDGLSYK